MDLHWPESEFTDTVYFGQILQKFLQDVYQSLTCCCRLNLVSVFPYLSSKGNRMSDCATFNTLCKKTYCKLFVLIGVFITGMNKYLQ